MNRHNDQRRPPTGLYARSGHLEVLKNSFITIVDQMAEQILRTCHSFVMYARDFSSALCDREGNTVMQGSADIAVHVGTLHFTAKAVIEAFGDDIGPGDVFAINDPYLGGTHFCDVRIVRPIFADGEIIGYSQSNGHWADIGGSVPGSFDVNAKEHFGEGLRIPPIRITHRGRYCADVVRMIVSNTRAPEAAEGDLHAQLEATRVAEIELLRLVDKYGRETVRHRDGRGAGLRRAPDPPARRRDARRHLGDDRLSGLRSRQGRGPRTREGADDDQGRPDPL